MDKEARRQQVLLMWIFGEISIQEYAKIVRDERLDIQA